MAETIWIEDDTSQRVFTLSQDGSAVNLTDATVSVVLRPAPRIGGDPRVYAAVLVDAVAGKVGWSPGDGQLIVSESPYTARFRVTLNGTKTYYPFPAPDTWQVIE